MALSFAFDSDTGETPDTLAAKRAIAQALASQAISSSPKNVGEGLTAIGDALAYRGAMGDFQRASSAAQKDYGNIVDAMINGGNASAQPASPASSISPAQPSIPSAGLSGNSLSDTPVDMSGGIVPQKASNAGPVADQSNRPSYVRGKLDAFGRQWDFGSGGGGNESIPRGDFPITPGAIGPWGQAHGAIGINNNVIPDSKLGRPRTGIEIHAGTNPDLITKGCIAIAGDQWQEFRQEVMRHVQNGEKLQLHVGPDGARIISSAGNVIGQSQGGGNPQIASNDPNFTPQASGGINPQLASMLSPNMTVGQGAFSQNQASSQDQPNITTLATRPANLPVDGQAPAGRVAVAQAMANMPQQASNPASPAIQTVAQAMGNSPAQTPTAASVVPPNVANLIKRAALSADPRAQALGTAMLQKYIEPQKPISVAPGAALVDPITRKTIYENQPKLPNSALEYQYYVKNLPPGSQPMDYATWSTAKARAGATQVSNNIDMGGQQSYDKQLAEGLAKSHASLSNGVEESQQRARDIAAMQGAIDQIQKNGGSTGGMGAEQILALKKTINSGANALGVNNPFNENDISDREFLQKFNRQIAGAQAKGTVGSRVTNFEMQNYLKSNPGLDMSITGNQRLLGIQAQIERRNIAVGNAIRQATAQAISQGKRIDPVTVQKLITDYDNQHHITDPVTSQDLTQSYALPEFQNGGSNQQKAQEHQTNIQTLQGKTSTGIQWRVQ